MRANAAHVDPVEMFAGVHRKTLAYGENAMICQIIFAPGGDVPHGTITQMSKQGMSSRAL